MGKARKGVKCVQGDRRSGVGDVLLRQSGGLTTSSRNPVEPDKMKEMLVFLRWLLQGKGGGWL